MSFCVMWRLIQENCKETECFRLQVNCEFVWLSSWSELITIHLSNHIWFDRLVCTFCVHSMYIPESRYSYWETFLRVYSILLWPQQRCSFYVLCKRVILKPDWESEDKQNWGSSPAEALKFHRKNVFPFCLSIKWLTYL